jgi:hypothetical protein
LDVGIGQIAAAQQAGDLLRVDLVVLGFGSGDGPHVQGVAQDEGDVFVVTQIGKPVPAEQALAADDEVVAVRGDGLVEGVGIGGQVLVEDDLAALVEDAQVHGVGVQIDAAVESVRLLVEAHAWSPWHGSGSLIPHRGWKAPPF